MNIEYMNKYVNIFNKYVTTLILNINAIAIFPLKSFQTQKYLIHNRVTSCNTIYETLS